MIDTEMSFWIEKKRDNQQATVAYLRNCRRKFDSKRMTWSHTSNERLPFLIEARGKLADLFLERVMASIAWAFGGDDADSRH